MKKGITVLILSVVFFSHDISSIASGMRGVSSGSAQKLVAEGIISTGEPEYAPTFTRDEKTVYFTRETRERRFSAIYVSRLVDGKWSKPEVAPFSGVYPDEYPSLSPDGSKLYFASRRPMTEGGNLKRYNDIWVVEFTSKGWGQPVHLGDVINTDVIDSHPSVAKDGTIYFHSNRDGNVDVYRSKLVSGKYSKPERLSFNSGAIDGEPFVAADESYVIFSSAREGGIGSGDLYITCLRNGQWTEARNLGPTINTTNWDGNPLISKNGKYIYVSIGDDKAWLDITQIELKEPISCVARSSAKSR